MIGGDLNEIFYQREKLGGPTKHQSVIDNFRDNFIENGLFDLYYLGYDFTWCNYQLNGMVVEKTLDQFCIGLN